MIIQTGLSYNCDRMEKKSFELQIVIANRTAKFRTKYIRKLLNWSWGSFFCSYESRKSLLSNMLLNRNSIFEKLKFIYHPGWPGRRFRCIHYCQQSSLNMALTKNTKILILILWKLVRQVASHISTCMPFFIRLWFKLSKIVTMWDNATWIW
jgi:hypothetical protein